MYDRRLLNKVESRPNLDGSRLSIQSIFDSNLHPNRYVPWQIRN
ncbi:hypothetical protein [Methylomonas fluvii]|nr:hypothetical protein [Methylomonas fluvii]